MVENDRLGSLYQESCNQSQQQDLSPPDDMARIGFRCQRCAKSKKGCTGGQPCERCRDANVPCIPDGRTPQASTSPRKADSTSTPTLDGIGEEKNRSATRKTDLYPTSSKQDVFTNGTQNQSSFSGAFAPLKIGRSLATSAASKAYDSLSQGQSSLGRSDQDQDDAGLEMDGVQFIEPDFNGWAVDLLKEGPVYDRQPDDCKKCFERPDKHAFWCPNHPENKPFEGPEPEFEEWLNMND